MKSRVSRSLSDLLIVIAIAITTGNLFVVLDMLEAVEIASREFKHWEIDELIGLSLGLFFGLFWFTWRSQRREGTLLQRELELVRKTQELELDRLDTLRHLSAGVAHEFNNLLTVITTNAEGLKARMPSDTGACGQLERISRSALRGGELTHRLLAYCRGQVLDAVTVDIDELLSNCSGLLRQSLGNGIELDLGCAEGLWPVEIDPVQLENALLTLAVNARDAMPGGGCLSIRAENVSLTGDGPEGLSGDVVVLKVSDTGEGVAPEVLERVLEPFFTTKPAGKGTGLGLSMVYGFVEQSGGKLEIESAVGDGTTIRIYLPRAEGEPEAREGVNGVADPAPGGATILVVEDEADLRDTAAEFLRELGYEVVEADSGASALAALNSTGHIDLLFTDIVMPGELDGFGLARAATDRRPDLKVLFTSGNLHKQQIADEDADLTGCFLRKPYLYNDLDYKVRAILDGTIIPRFAVSERRLT